MVSASIVTALDRHSGSASVLVSAVLVLVTIYYAAQNRAMALEARRSREAASRPKLALDFMRFDTSAMALAIRSIGPGTAFDIDVTITWQPTGGAQPTVQSWQRPVLEAGERRNLMPAGAPDDNVNTLPTRFESVRMTGSMRDAHGAKHDVDEGIADLAAWRRGLAESHERFELESPERRMAQAFDPVLNNQADRLERALMKIGAALGDQRGPAVALAAEPQPQPEPADRTLQATQSPGDHQMS